jgi:hypothetical protein
VVYKKNQKVLVIVGAPEYWTFSQRFIIVVMTEVAAVVLVAS